MAKFDGDNSNEDEKKGRPGRLPVPANRLQIVEPRCNICKSQHRKDVDRYIAMGLSQIEVIRWFEAYDGTSFTPKSMSTHVNRHLTLHAHAVRSIIEDEAREIVGNIDNVKGFLVTKKAAAKIALQKGFDAMMDGHTTVEPEILLKYIEKLEAWEKEDQEVSVDEMRRDFNAFAQAVKDMIDWVAAVSEIAIADLEARLYEGYEAAISNTALPMVLRGSIIDLPVLAIPAELEAEFDELDEKGGEENGSE